MMPASCNVAAHGRRHRPQVSFPANLTTMCPYVPDWRTSLLHALLLRPSSWILIPSCVTAVQTCCRRCRDSRLLTMPLWSLAALMSRTDPLAWTSTCLLPCGLAAPHNVTRQLFRAPDEKPAGQSCTKYVA